MKLKDRARSWTTRRRRDIPRRRRGHPDSRATGIAVTLLIAAGTAIVSYTHGLDVVRAAGNHGLVAGLLPLFPDGLITLSSAALFTASALGVSCGWAWCGLVIGLGVTLAMNVLASLPPQTLALILRSGWPGGVIGALTPGVLFLSIKILEWLFRHQPEPAAAPTGCPHEVPASAADGAATDFLHKRDCLGEAPTYLDVAGRWGIDRRRMPELVAAMSARVAALRDAAADDPDDILAAAGA
jgi:hypothetical protein